MWKCRNSGGNIQQTGSEPGLTELGNGGADETRTRDLLRDSCYQTNLLSRTLTYYGVDSLRQ
jgi:hypothetical protein